MRLRPWVELTESAAGSQTPRGRNALTANLRKPVVGLGFLAGRFSENLQAVVDFRNDLVRRRAAML
ncbi:MAG: hypothetical protein D4R73_04875 [Deltaproteobacteria bacterium]|nr:MAG: hypothetical protein D4R73_04875 [Deltaproteobacteria bacterium]